jgi:hypothetical protein
LEASFPDILLINIIKYTKFDNCTIIFLFENFIGKVLFIDNIKFVPIIPNDNNLKQTSSTIIKSVKGFISSGFGLIKDGVVDFFTKLTGDDKDIDKAKEKMNDVMSTVFGEAKDNVGNMAAGALVGTGVSLLTGAVVGPLFGAAIGAGAGLLINSEQVQEVLFGKKDEKGNRDYTGLLTENMAKFIEEKVPSMGKGAVLGGAAGLFMGSPFLGAILGAGAGFISKSEGAKEFLFGNEKDENSGLINKKIRDKIKEHIPGISAGMIAGAVAGPFGLAGNLIFGAGLGYLATSEEFKNELFGAKDEKTGKREGGLLGTLRNKMLNPLSELFVNTGKRVGDWLSRTGKRLTNILFK